MSPQRVPLGRPLPELADDFEEPAPDELDKQALLAAWDQYAPAKYKGMLDAKLGRPGPKQRSDWVWVPEVKEYHHRSGTVVDQDEARQAVEAFTQALFVGKPA